MELSLWLEELARLVEEKVWVQELANSGLLREQLAGAIRFRAAALKWGK